MTPRYATPDAFKQAVEHRLLAEANARGIDVNRVRQLLVFDRFLARAFMVNHDLVLKGGLVLDLRVARARATRDVDLRAVGEVEDIMATLQRAGQLDLGDYIRFTVEPDREHPTIEGDGVVYGGRRFRVRSSLAGRAYAAPFGVDIVIGGPVTGDVEVVAGRPFLAFADIVPAQVRLVPIEQHIAEKLHAMTMPRTSENSRVRDLPDLLMLGSIRPLAAELVRLAIRSTFEFRATHPVPGRVPAPPATWANKYSAMAAEIELSWPSLDAAGLAVGAFLDPVLAGGSGTWNPTAWTP
jgi:hypothetical protein